MQHGNAFEELNDNFVTGCIVQVVHDAVEGLSKVLEKHQFLPVEIRHCLRCVQSGPAETHRQQFKLAGVRCLVVTTPQIHVDALFP